VYYPIVPAIALILAIVLFIAMAISNLSTIIWVIAAFAFAICYYFIYSKLTSNATAELD
jgi:ethanolamine permease